MNTAATTKPTESELEILNILWTLGPATVRDVHEQLLQTKEAGYTTTLKLMQIMLEKKLLSRDASQKTHVYTAIVNREQTQGQMLQRMIQTMFNGSPMQLVMQALGSHKASKAELEQIREYLEQKTKK
jgi:BlaI family transcriptional regulator, penicillinase repressor